MSPTIRQYNCRFLNKAGNGMLNCIVHTKKAPAGRILVAQPGFEGRNSGAEEGPRDEARHPDAAYALLLLMMMITLLLISFAAALPSVTMEAQREREEELIFRGNEYVRAIALYHSRFARYPTTVDELLKKTNGIRFLRRAYKDPMTKSGKWRFIHVNAAGVPIDSKTMSLQAGMAMGNSPTGANSTMGFGFGQSQSSNSPMGGASGFGGGFGQAGSQGNVTSGFQSGTSPGAAGGASASGGQTQRETGADTDTEGASGTQQSGGFMNGIQTTGAFIAGVASRSRKHSVRVWNGKSHYDEWEFIGTAVNLGGTQLIATPGGIGSSAVGGMAGQGGSQMGQTGQMGQSGGTGQFGTQPIPPSQPQAPVAQPVPAEPDAGATDTPVAPDSTEPQP